MSNRADPIRADDVANTRQISDVRSVGALAAKAGSTGVPLVDQGAACDRETGDSACMLNIQQRRDLLLLLMPRISDAGTNYKLAIQDLRIDQLLEEEEDLSWVASLVLDLAGAHIVGKFAAHLARLKKSSLDQMGELLHRAALFSKQAPRATERAVAALSKLTDKDIESGVKAAMDLTKKGFSAAVKSNPDAAEGKDSNLGYLERLQDGAGVGFDTLRSNVAATATDGEMLALYESFDPAAHTVSAYKVSLGAKLSRFNKSGVAKIGRTHAMRAEGSDPKLQHRRDVMRDTRVVWARYPSGRMELRFQTHDGERDPGVIRPGDPGTRWMGPQSISFGAQNSIAAPELGDVVPAEFIEAAQARHLHVWRLPPPTVHLVENASWFDADKFAHKSVRSSPGTNAVSSSSKEGLNE